MGTSETERIILLLQRFESESTQPNSTDENVFKTLGKLDAENGSNPTYALNINGTLCNIGTDRSSLRIITCAIRRLKTAIRTATETDLNKLMYDLAAAIHTKASIKAPYPRTNKDLASTPEFYEARKVYANFNTSPLDSNFAQALTNSANILDQFGRNYESIHLYDQVLKSHPTFGMALGNKAKALTYYHRLNHHDVPIAVLRFASRLLKAAIRDKELEIVGGKPAIEHFRQQIPALESFLAEFPRPERTHRKKPSEYELFCRRRRLFLNLHFGLRVSQASLHDHLYPAFIQSATESTYRGGFSETVFFCTRLYNQIIEDYSSARTLFFHTINSTFEFYDNVPKYIYAFDMSRHSTYNGILKLLYARLFNILDKVASICYAYFLRTDTAKFPSDFNFDWLTRPEFLQFALDTDNPQIFALNSMATDFKSGNVYAKFRKRRNAIVHRYLDIQKFSVDSEDQDRISPEELLQDIEDLFIITKASILYVYTAIRHQTRLAENNGPLGRLDATFQDEIFED